MTFIVKTLAETIVEHEKERKELIDKLLKGEARWGAWRYNPENLTLELDPKVSGHPEDNPYYVELERCNNSDDILDWLLHTLENVWCTKEQVGYLLQAINDLADLHRVIGKRHFNMGKHLSRMRLEGDEKLLKVGEVADRLRVSRLSVYRMIKDKKLKAIRLPLGRKGEIRISEDELDRFLSESSFNNEENDDLQRNS